MLRTVFVAAIVVLGILYSFKGPFYALLFYLWLAYFRPEYWMWVDWVTPIRLSLIVGTLLIIATVLSPPRRGAHASSQIWIFALVFAVSLSSALNSVAPAWSWFWWVEFAKALVVSFMIVLHTRDHSRFRLVLMVIAFSLGLEGAKQGWAQFVRNPGAVNMNVHPMLGDNNGVAVGMFMLAPIFSALAATASSQRAKWLYNFFWVGVILRGVTTYSRGGFLSGAALAGVYVLRSQRRLRAIAAVVVVGALLLPVLPDDFWNRMGTITAERDSRDASAEGRLHMWAVAWRMAADHPFTGVGFNAYNRAYDAYDSSRGAFGEERAVHSSWFGALAEMGYPGLVCLVAAVVLGLWNAQRVMRVARRTLALGNLLPYALAVQASLIVYCVGGTFINTQYSEMMWHLLALSIALRNIAFEPVPSETPALAPGGTMVGPPLRPVEPSL